MVYANNNIKCLHWCLRSGWPTGAITEEKCCVFVDHMCFITETHR